MNRRDILRGAAAAAAGVLLPHDALAAPSDPRDLVPLGLRRAGDRGHANHGWLDTWHSFSFASYRDPRWMGFRSLRVINEDVIEKGRGFPLHPHEDMEILTWVLDGALEHKDTLGNGGVIRPGELQRMSAGRGIQHSEFNPSRSEGVHLLQIWIAPSKRGVAPRYEQTRFPKADRTGTLRLVASPTGRDGSIPIHQDAHVWTGILTPEASVAWKNPAGRHVWLQVARGRVTANGRSLGPGDAVYATTGGRLELKAVDTAEVLLFDLA